MNNCSAGSKHHVAGGRVMRALSLASVTLLMSSPPSLAQDARSNRSDPHAQKTPQVVCRNEASSGSRIQGRRICLTEQQWRDLSAASQSQAKDFSNEQSKATMGAIPNG